eukprot:364599-Chlamydomonas_euryale.AAC.2
MDRGRERVTVYGCPRRTCNVHATRRGGRFRGGGKHLPSTGVGRRRSTTWGRITPFHYLGQDGNVLLPGAGWRRSASWGRMALFRYLQ